MDGSEPHPITIDVTLHCSQKGYATNHSKSFNREEIHTKKGNIPLEMMSINSIYSQLHRTRSDTPQLKNIPLEKITETPFTTDAPTSFNREDLPPNDIEEALPAKGLPHTPFTPVPKHTSRKRYPQPKIHIRLTRESLKGGRQHSSNIQNL